MTRPQEDSKLIGRLTQQGNGSWVGQFSLPVNPGSITVSSNLGGSATATVKAR